MCNWSKFVYEGRPGPQIPGGKSDSCEGLLLEMGMKSLHKVSPFSKLGSGVLTVSRAIPHAHVCT